MKSIITFETTETYDNGTDKNVLINQGNVKTTDKNSSTVLTVMVCNICSHVKMSQLFIMWNV